ncbi:MAG: T9SS type A sorting domain-containing protein [Saprospiraceae bacterium]
MNITQHAIFRILVLSGILLFSIYGAIYWINPKPHTTFAGFETEKVPEEWLERIHKAAPGDDWRAIEAKSIRQLLAAKKQHYSNIFGSWVERGPSNIPGRIVDMEIEYGRNRIYAISDHGIVFQSDDLAGANWKALNDQFPLGQGVASQLKVFEDGKIVTCGWIKVDNYWGTYYSIDKGHSWNKSTGFSNREITGMRRLAKSGSDVYLFVQEYDPTVVSDYYVVYKSIDKGSTFSMVYQSSIPVGDGGRHNKSDMWVSNDVQEPNFYLTLEDSLFSVDKTTGNRSFKGLISCLPIQLGMLSGLTKNGITELKAYVAVGDNGKFYSWNSIDQVWSYKGEMTDWWLSKPFGPNSFTCSQNAADTLYFGGLLTSKSIDGGSTWITMDMDPTGSYALYHGDVPKTYSTVDPLTGEESFYLGTDGGIYKLDENEHFVSMSIPGLNCTQIYKMVSRHESPGEMFIGTQDNGYSHTNLGIDQPGVVDFTFQYGGDVTNVASGDKGQTFWLWWLGDGCNYMAGTDQVVSTWTPYDFNGGIPYWEAPIWIPSQHPDQCFTAGYLNSSTGNYLIKLQANNGAQAIPTQFAYDFEAQVGAKISAIAISPIDFNYFYAATENGYFCYSTDGGISWQKTLLSQSMYPRVIHPSSVNLGEVWVGGSGYSNSPIFYSNDNGQSFSNFNSNMPACRVEAFATNEDESVIYAATSIGPFAYEKAEGKWSDISEQDAPIVQYMDVEYLPEVKTARFATYARGGWDYQVMTSSVSQQIYLPNALKVMPNPAVEFVVLEFSAELNNKPYVITDITGQVIIKGKFELTQKQIDVSSLSPGVYFISPPFGGFRAVNFVKI